MISTSGGSPSTRCGLMQHASDETRSFELAPDDPSVQTHKLDVDAVLRSLARSDRRTADALRQEAEGRIP